MDLVALDTQVEEALEEIGRRSESLKKFYRMRGDLSKSMRKSFLFDIRIRLEALERAEEEGKFD